LRELRDAIRASTTAPTLAAGGGAAGGGAAGGGTAGDGATRGGAATGGMATGAAAPADSAAAMESRTGAGQAPRRRRPAAWLVAAAVLVGVIAAAIWLVPAVRDAVSTRHGSAPVDLAVTDRPMIAVLPFETLGPPENAYFAAGITEEITSRLAGIEGLGVISRTSAVQYAGTTKSLREIGDELGVDYVLEGTVRWAPGAGGRDRVRITPQLIRVADDTHLWADQYDDVLGDVFAVQSEIARGVVRELGITLLRPGEESLAHKPTSDLAAYEAYLRALDSESRTEVIELLERAVELDPTFAEAWALLANQHAARYRFEGDATPDRLAAADSTLARATALAPENPDVLWAAAYVQYYAHDDYDRALEIFDRLLDRNPSSARACEGKAYIRRRQGRFEDAIALLEAAHQLDPRDANIVFNLAQTREATRSFESAEADYRRAIILRPEQCYYYDRWAWLALEQSGDVGEALSRVSECPGKEPSAIGLQLLFMADRHEDVLAATERMLRGTTIPTRQGALHTFRARSLRELGRTVLAESEAVIGRDLLEGAVAQGSENSFARLVLAVNLATFGQPEAAVALGKEAIALTAVDRFAGPRAELYLAAFYMHAGRMDEGVRLLERLLVARYERPVTVPLLRVGWIFEPFHDEPAFQELLERHAGDGHGT
jgi:TolB-like protein/tetratricopeptide (TPR) repeat protein